MNTDSSKNTCGTPVTGDSALLLCVGLGLAPLAAMAVQAAVMAIQKVYVCSTLGWEVLKGLCI